MQGREDNLYVQADPHCGRVRAVLVRICYLATNAIVDNWTTFIRVFLNGRLYVQECSRALL